MVKGDVVIAGDVLYAGIDEEDRSLITNAVVVMFKNGEDFSRAMREKKISFTMFGVEEESEG